ncbi:MAG: 1,4-dihydroxy-6-naphthoate synthase [Candidatus Tyrphobacter sp.]
MTDTLAYSPCPNDTYVFAALANGLLAGRPHVRVVLADVEALNDAAQRGEYEVTKISYGAIPPLVSRYRVLRCGGALGRGCGPLAVVREQHRGGLESLAGKRVAIPGARTTAYLLLRLALHAMGIDAVVPVEMRFDRIVEAVAAGRVDAGLIIHESRFTYQERGLRSAIDLGRWWESTTGLPIPLGAILARDDLGSQRSLQIADAIRASLRFARGHESEIFGYVREHAFEMSEQVMRKHIALYVNEFTDDLGEEGVAAVRVLLGRAHDAGLAAAAEPRFL